jgi:hypothetical protein
VNRRGLSAADWRAYCATLVQPHRERTLLRVESLAGVPGATLTGYFDDGQVDMDVTAAVTRTATITLHDPRRSLPFDSDHPSDTALFMDRMIRVSSSVLVGDTWRTRPVFTGPVTKLDRDGDLVTAECQGKEVLALGASWAPMTLRKGMKKTDAIRRIMAERAGETFFDIPDLSARLPKHVVLSRESVPWLVARRIARSMALQLFYDGAGVCTLRRVPGVVGFAFTGTHHVTTPPQISWSTEGVVNAVYVLGGVPKGSKTHVHASAVAPRSHPLSPWRLGRNGVPRYLTPNGQIVQDDMLKTVAECKARAERIVHDGLLMGVDASFDSVPIGFLDPQDLCRVSTDDGDVTFRLRSFSLPLSAASGQGMSVGYHKRVTRPRPRRKNRR